MPFVSIPRRSFVQYFFRLIALPIMACSDTQPSNDGRHAGEIEDLLSQTDPAVARLIRRIELPEGRVLLLARFFADVAQNINLSGRLPLLLTIDDTNNVSRRELYVARQMTILQERNLRFIEMNPGRDILLVYTLDGKAQTADALDDLTDKIQSFLPNIDRFFRDLFTSSWLHCHLSSKRGISHTLGYNMVLAKGNEKVPIVVAHELVHTYNSQWASSTPTFLTEGIAGLLSALLTSTRTELLIPSGKVHLGYMTYDGSTQSIEEGTNGVLFLKALLEETGLESFQQALTEASRANPVTGQTILRSFKKFSPRPLNVETLYRLWIEDYTPGLAD